MSVSDERLREIAAHYGPLCRKRGPNSRNKPSVRRDTYEALRELKHLRSLMMPGEGDIMRCPRTNIALPHCECPLHYMHPPAAQSEIDALNGELQALRREVAAARKLWTYLKELRDPWGEYQDFFVEAGLLEKVAIPKDTPEDQRCEDCDGDCDWCYRDSGLIGPLPEGRE